jgi:hypothetical protein
MQTAHASKNGLAAQPSPTPATTRCRHCGDVIGVYEPMIVITDGRARSTSRAAEIEAGGPLEQCYHDACCEPAHREGSKPDPRPVSPG